MAMQDIQWGGLVVGAVVATAMVLISPPVAISGFTVAGKISCAILFGGLAGEFLHHFFDRTGSAASSVTSWGRA